jgi:hypothetical protein|tara:strand:+ start:223 stop:645 length:423 start_codon:yes stop_codon:yes gene_type:complete
MSTSNDVVRIFEKQETLSADKTLIAADSGKHFILDNATGETVTLPALAEGLIFRFSVGAAFATDNWVIDSAEGDNINGIIMDMGSTVAGVPAAAEDQINFVASAETIGDWIELTCDYGNSQWLVTGACTANGGITATDPS